MSKIRREDPQFRIGDKVWYERDPKFSRLPRWWYGKDQGESQQFRIGEVVGMQPIMLIVKSGPSQFPILLRGHESYIEGQWDLPGFPQRIPNGSVQPSWHPNAACLPFCGTHKCSHYTTLDADVDEEGFPCRPQNGCTLIESLPGNCPEFCPDCGVCLPALWFGLKKGETL